MPKCGYHLTLHKTFKETWGFFIYTIFIVMPNVIKSATTVSTGTIKKNNFVNGVDALVDYGPTLTTNFWNGRTPPVSGYTVYEQKLLEGPSIREATNDSELITIAKQYGGTNINTITDALTYLNGQSKYLVANIDYPSIVTDGLVFNLDAGYIPSYPRSGTNWTDLSGNGYDGTLLNGPTFDSGNGGSIMFDGTDAYVRGSSDYSINSTQPFTMEFWANLSAYSPGFPCLFQIKTNTSFGFIVMVTQSISYSGINFGSSNSWVRLRNNGNQLSTNIWYNIVITYNGNGNGTSSNYKMYLNTIQQTLVGSATYVALTQVNNIGTILNGSRGSDDWNGRISIVRLYNRELSSTEVLQNYNVNKSRYGL